MTSRPLGSDPFAAFDLLHREVQRWIWEQGWDELRDVQARSIPAIITGDRDVIIAAATAGGKTEAAFLPIVSRIATDDAPGFKALYVSPLKALINDQWRRLDGLCERLDIPVFRWHGDVSDGSKRRAREKPNGIVLITPESLEALFVRRAMEIPRLFDNLRFVVVDELHAFIGSERGVQLQSLLKRLEVAISRRVPRVGLSATLGDMRGAATHLRPDAPHGVTIVESTGGGQELRVQVRGYLPEDGKERDGPDEADAAPPSVMDQIARHLFERLRGTHNLVFAGSRQRVELYADYLRRCCEAAGMPNEFFPHHGNLSRNLRQDVEQRLREGKLPTTAVCTTTLELGIDIGAVESVAQIGPPRSIAALRQRLGRSGRRKGKPAILRIYVEERALGADEHPFHRLRTDLVQAVAAVRLLVERWYEPPERYALNLSTLLHQTLALIAQRGGATAAALYGQLAGPGPFEAVSPPMYAALLRRLGDPECGLIEQAPDGALMLGHVGERLVEHYGFYAVFETPEEFRVVSGGRTLGTVPIDSPLAPDTYIVFAGRRWRVTSVDSAAKVVEVEAAAGGIPPSFGGTDGGAMHDRVVEEMRTVYEAGDVPPFLDPTALALLAEGRTAYRDLELARARLLAAGDRVLLLPWVGTRKLTTLALALQAKSLKPLVFSIGLEIGDCDAEEVVSVLRELVKCPPPAGTTLAMLAANKASRKYDSFLPPELLEADFASRWLEPACLPGLAADLLE